MKSEIIENEIRKIVNGTGKVFQNPVSHELTDQIQSYLKQNIHDDSINIEILTQMFIGAVSQTVRWWLERQNQIEKEEVITQFSLIFNMYFKKGE